MRIQGLKQAALLLLLIAATVSAFAAGKNSIKGKVLDINNQKPIGYATIFLLSLPDSTIKSSAITNEDGSYQISNIAEGSFVIKAQFVGYKPAISPRFTATTATEIPVITLEPSAVIKEVTVLGKRPFIEKKADRTVLNIESSAAASAESAYEVLKKAPNVNIDKDDNININGKQGVTILINERPTYLSGSDLANYLKTVQGAEIEKVEIINNPPSKYDAAGNTGVINIKIKRTVKPGFNGNISAGITYNGKVGSTGGVNLNMRNGKTNVYASYNPGTYAGNSTIDIERYITYKGITSYFNQANNGDWRYNANNFKAGVDYDINKNNTIGIMVSGYGNSNREHLNGSTIVYNGKPLPDSSIVSNNPTTGTFDDINYNLNYRSVLDTLGREFTVDADYARFNNTSTTYNNSYYYNSTGNETRQPLKLLSRTPSEITIKSIKADYVHPISQHIKLETGVKSSMVKTDNDLVYKKFAGNDYAFDPSRSNHFIFDENILAGYASLAIEHNNTSIKGGLRAEQTWSKGNSITENKVVNRSYIDFFPTFFIQQKLNEKNSIGLSYNRRIDRPRYQQLNPFRVTLDEYTMMEGNPFLRPQYTNNISLNYSWSNMLFSEITYTHTKNVMVDIVEQDDATKVGKQIPRNLSSLNGISWTNSINLSPTSWFRSNNNITTYYNSYKKVDNSLSQSNSKLSANISTMNSFMLPKKFTFDILTWYQSQMVYGMFQMKDMWAMNVGIQKTFLNDNLRIKLSVDDIFNSLHSRALAIYDNVNLRSRNTWSSQRVGLNITYRFGKSNMKPSRHRNSGSEDEMNRVNTGSK